MVDFARRTEHLRGKVALAEDRSPEMFAQTPQTEHLRGKVGCQIGSIAPAARPGSFTRP